VTSVSLLGPILTLTTLEALSGLDPTVLDAGPEVSITASEVRYIEARWLETVVRARPWVPHRRMATLAKGTRLAVRGEVESRDDAGCHGKAWYAVWPFGYVCSEHVRPTDTPPELGTALPVAPGKRLPHVYATVRYDGASEYADAEMAEYGLPKRPLTKGMSLVVHRTVQVAGATYVETQDGTLIAKEDVGWMGQGSAWRGVVLDAERSGPLMAWVNKADAKVYQRPDAEATVVQTHDARERVPVFEAEATWRRIGPDAWIPQKDLNEVWVLDPPEGVLTEVRTQATGNDQWIDVDVGEQVLVAYRGHSPVYATLISSGRGSPTPLGNYPMWAKVASMDMANQDYEDKPYMVQGVPWVVLFQGHNALHGAYWHDRFGNRKSHGCVNLAPLDAHWVFEWIGPSLPVGWTGYLPGDLHRSVTIHVRDSSKGPAERFTQERPWGPPDAEEERRKAEAAAQRRDLVAQEAAAALPDVNEDLVWGPPTRLDAPSLPRLMQRGE
jgi:hypothetical protein